MRYFTVFFTLKRGNEILFFLLESINLNWSALASYSLLSCLSTYTFSALTLLVGWVAGRESGL